MSLNTSLLMIRGDHLQQVPAVFEIFKYRLTGKTREVDDWSDALAAANARSGTSREIAYKVAFFHSGWTVILDVDCVMWTNNGACTDVSRRLGSRVFAMCCSGVSSMYAYCVFEGDRTRTFWWGPEGIIDDRGDRLPEEEGIDFDQSGEEAVLEVMQRFGVNYLDFDSVDAFRVFEIDESDMLAKASPSAETHAEAANKGPKKPWWRFW